LGGIIFEGGSFDCTLLLLDSLIAAGKVLNMTLMEMNGLVKRTGGGEV
jgi:hypothetical protein